MKEVKMPSGAVLRIGDIPFEDAKNLYQALLKTAKHINLTAQSDAIALAKEFFCVGFSSKRIEASAWKCVERCTYNGKKITKETFEDKAARGDYMDVMFEVTVETVNPFMKSLYAKFGAITEKIASYQA